MCCQNRTFKKFALLFIHETKNIGAGSIGLRQKRTMKEIVLFNKRSEDSIGKDYLDKSSP